ncbi:winged helix-turn-helix transcriptional regulator [Actinoplanes solisilvae]|uniref:winged helix-turn-helix transcriptional regulator n=1 Tax=Actinoplanes solisilvae TaxID=2486853 RepID=UPI000FDAE8AF|nr:helix-turn-helix domain-containing protein [Actinoplanes solisilvae]
MKTPDNAPTECRQVQSVLDTVGRRWSGAILVAASRGARRFVDFRRTVPGISDRMLSVRLKELETLGLLRREVIPSTPVQILYEPTALGRELLHVLQPLFRWGEKHLDEVSAATP